MYKIILLPVLLLFCTVVRAQENFSISGSLIDDKHEEVAFATVGLFNSSDSSLVEGTITNIGGAFEFKNIQAGDYYIRISHLLYDLFQTDVLLQGDIKLEAFQLKQSSLELDEVTVSGERMAVQNEIDKIIINPDQMLAGKGGSATDVLRSIPIVHVTPEGGISIRGGGDIQILVNGKPSGMVAVQGTQFLNQIDASTIERIEVITNPSAKHGSDGGSGIINVILKKEKTEGMKGNVLVSIGNRERYILSPSISYRKNDLNFFLGYSLLQNTRRTKGFGDQIRNDTIQLMQNNSGRFKDLRHNLEFGADYFFDERKYLTLSGLYRYRDKSSRNFQTSNVEEHNILQEERTTNNSEPEKNNGYGMTISYFSDNEDETQKTEILLDVVHSVEDETIDRRDVLSNMPSNEIAFTGGISNYVDVNDGIFFDVALIRPFGGGTLDLGARYFYRNIDQDFDLRLVSEETGILDSDFEQQDVFSYNDHVSAVYGEFAKDVNKFKLGGGVRIEYSANNYSTQAGDEEFRNTFFNIFPSLKFGYKLSPSSSVQFNYGRRINRPAPNRLNPFPNIGNPFQIVIGNPDLDPEFIDSYNLGYSNNFKNSSLTINFFYKKYHDLIQRISTIDDEGLRTVSPVNLDALDSYGFDASYSWDISDKWDLNTGFVFFRNDFESQADDIQNQGFTQQYKTTSNLKITDKLDWQISGFFNSAEVNSQGERLEQYYVDTGFNYELIVDKAELTLSVTDIFNTLKEINRIGIESLQSRSERKVDTRIARFSFSYKF